MGRTMVKKLAGHNPSYDVNDIRLAPKQYLIAGPVISDSDSVETTGGIWVPATKDMKLTNTAKVLKVGEGCTLAKVGEYVVFSSITGESYNHLKPQPIYRDYFDESGIYTLGEECIRAVIPEAKETQSEAG